MHFGLTISNTCRYNIIIDYQLLCSVRIEYVVQITQAFFSVLRFSVQWLKNLNILSFTFKNIDEQLKCNLSNLILNYKLMQCKQTENYYNYKYSSLSIILWQINYVYRRVEIRNDNNVFFFFFVALYKNCYLKSLFST